MLSEIIGTFILIYKMFLVHVCVVNHTFKDSGDVATYSQSSVESSDVLVRTAAQGASPQSPAEYNYW